eukprot:5788887-Prorocentrum_lima.AAC.1
MTPPIFRLYSRWGVTVSAKKGKTFPLHEAIVAGPSDEHVEVLHRDQASVEWFHLETRHPAQ